MLCLCVLTSACKSEAERNEDIQRHTQNIESETVRQPTTEAVTEAATEEVTQPITEAATQPVTEAVDEITSNPQAMSRAKSAFNNTLVASAMNVELKIGAKVYFMMREMSYDIKIGIAFNDDGCAYEITKISSEEGVTTEGNFYKDGYEYRYNDDYAFKQKTGEGPSVMLSTIGLQKIGFAYYEFDGANIVCSQINDVGIDFLKAMLGNSFEISQTSCTLKTSGDELSDITMKIDGKLNVDGVLAVTEVNVDVKISDINSVDEIIYPETNGFAEVDDIDNAIIDFYSEQND